MTADELFKTELANRGLQYKITEEGLYRVKIGDTTATVDLKNVRRNFERDRDDDAIARFAKLLDVDLFDEADWADAKPLVRYSLEPADYENGFDDKLHEVVTEKLLKVFVLTPPDGSWISWITDSTLNDWQVSREEVIQQANDNMNRLIGETTLKIDEVDGVKLGMLAMQDTAFKASLILSPRFRDLVSPTLGWPVYVVAPARDFVYVLSRDNRDFLGRLGRVVVREYNQSGHSVTQEVLEVGDDGVKAIGSFAPKES